MAGFSISGFDELRDDLRKMAKGADELSRKGSVSFGELFTPEFMAEHTEFGTLQEFFDASGCDYESLSDEARDAHVASNSDFEGWEDMLSAATDKYVSKMLGF